MRRLLIALTALLVIAPPAFAGGWATVGLSSTPAGIAPGQPWNVDIEVLQHGQTPLSGVTPTLTITNGDATKTFTATPTKQTGVYRASVTFPAAGEWTYTVNDGFISNQAHSFPPVEITTAATTAGDGISLRWLAIPAIALILAAIALLARRSHQPQAA